MATFQLTEQTQQQITDIQSLNMMRNTIRTAVSSVAYLRNLFDEEAFEDKNVSGLQLKVLRPFNPESKLILNWLEDGVFDALERQYLKLLVFGIHGESDELLESYHFYFSYSEIGTTINLERKIKDCDVSQIEGISNSKLCSKEYAKQQTIQLLRALILLTQSLSPLPEARYISMKLWYYEDRVPKNYEPSHFKPARTSDILSFDEVPIETMIGNIDTKFHNLSVKVKSAVENCENINFYSTNHDIQNKTFRNKKRTNCKNILLKKSFPNNYGKKQDINQELFTESSHQSNEIVVENVPFIVNNSPADNRTIRTTNTVELLDKAVEIVKFLKFVNKSNLAMALDIEKEKASNMIEALLEYGILSSKLIKGKGYPVINKKSGNQVKIRKQTSIRKKSRI